MALVMVLNRDPNRSLVATGIFLAAATAFSAYAVRVFLPLLRDDVGADNGGGPREPVPAS